MPGVVAGAAVRTGVDIHRGKESAKQNADYYIGRGIVFNDLREYAAGHLCWFKKNYRWIITDYVLWAIDSFSSRPKGCGEPLYLSSYFYHNVSVLNWIRGFGKNVQELHATAQQIEMVEIDEMHSYIGSKKTAAGFGLLLIDMERDFSISLLATGATKRQKNSGKK